MASLTPIRVLLADDHAEFRQEMCNLLALYPDLEVAGQVGDGVEAVESVGRLHPTVVLMDINMQKMDGITATRLIANQYPEVAILGLSCDTREYFFNSMKRAGAFDVLTKEQSEEEIYHAIQRAVASMSDD